MKKGLFKKIVSTTVIGVVSACAFSFAGCDFIRDIVNPDSSTTPVNKTVITNCDSLDAKEVLSLYQGNDITWVKDFTDVDGVKKDGCLKLSFSGDMDGDVVMLTLNDQLREVMLEEKFDYFEMTICVDNDDSYDGAYFGYTLYSARLSIPQYGEGTSLACRKWQTVRFTLKDLFRQDVITYCFQDDPSENIDDFREFVLEKYKPGSTFFHLSDWFKGQTVNLYFDSLTWGKFGPDTKAPVITTDSELTAEVGVKYTLPEFKANDERDGQVKIQSVELYKEGGTNPILISGETITFNEPGMYTFVVTASDVAGNCAEERFTLTVNGATADEVPPEITANGLFVAEVGVEYTLPTFTAVDDRDGEVAISSVELFKAGDTTALTVTEGKITFTEAGNYTIVVKASDAAGNEAEKSYPVTVAEASNPDDPVAANVIATFDSAGKLGVLGITNVENGISFVESFTDTDGVTKEGLMKLAFSGNAIGDDASVNQLVTMVLSADTLAKMRNAEFDYLEIVICVDNDDQYGGAYGGYTLYSRHKSIPPYGQDTSLRCRKWQTVRITLKDLGVKGTYLNDTDSDYTVAEARQAFIEKYAEENYFFHMSDWFAGQTIQMYIDSIIWGVDGPDTTAPEISAKGLFVAEAGVEYSLPAFKAVDDRDGEVAISSVELFKEGDTTALTVVDGKITFTEAGNYTIVVKASDAAGNEAEKSYTVTVAEASIPEEPVDGHVIASFDSAAKLGVLGLLKTEGGVSFAESHTDKNGVTKEGLMKLSFSGNNGAEVITMVLSEEMIAKMSAANFDYIELVICMDNIDSYNEAYGGWSFYSFNKSIPDYRVNPIKGKTWTTVRVTLEDLAAAGTYVSDANTLTVEEARAAFLTMYAEAANFFNISSWFDGQDVTLYVDSIVWGVNGAEPEPEPVDEHVIASFDSVAKLGVLGLLKTEGGVSFAESHTDKNGVTKEGLMKLSFSGNNGAEVITMLLSEEMIAKMSAANFDYIELVICMDNIDSYNEAYGGWSFYSFNKSIPDYRVNPIKGKTWTTVRVTLEDLAAAGTYVSDANTLTVEEARAAFLTMYAEAANFFNLSSWFDGQDVTLYVDSIVWGVNGAEPEPEPVDEHAIATYDNAEQLGVLSLSRTENGVSFAESYTDKNGVTKEGLMLLTFSGDSLAEEVRMILSDDMIAKMSAAKFDYLELVVCVDNIDSYNEAYGGWSFYSFNKSIPDYNVNPIKGKTWTTVRFSLADMTASSSYVGDGKTLEGDEARAEFLSYHSSASNCAHYLFNMSSWFSGQTVNLYIDSITWGVNEA